MVGFQGGNNGSFRLPSSERDSKDRQTNIDFEQSGSMINLSLRRVKRCEADVNGLCENDSATEERGPYILYQDRHMHRRQKKFIYLN